MEKLIPIINKLQDVYTSLGNSREALPSINLPQIVVIGSQSAGKSSVLENIVGKDFLPRGSNIVTRRPLVLQLIHTTTETKEGHGEWGEFLHKPGEFFYDFHRIRDEIDADTERLVGRNKGISHVPINLKIFSPNVLNLTLVDLPGITRVPVGDQPKNIEQQIRAMCHQYIRNPNAIVLAVSAANTDLANSDALQLAREVDPDGRRTLGVITKIDLMDEGTDALDILMGRVVPLRLGFIGVVNRSQASIDSSKPIVQALDDEARFFRDHPKYGAYAAKMGTPFLAKTLNYFLMHHIHETLPSIKEKVRKLLGSATEELNNLGDIPLTGAQSQGAILLQLLTDYSRDFIDAIDGRLAYGATEELYGGARIAYIFTKILPRQLKNLDPRANVTQEDIRTAIRNASGPRSALFTPNEAFELLAKNQIQRLERPGLMAVDLVYKELVRIMHQCPGKRLRRFRVLNDRVIEVTNRLLRECLIPTRKMIEDMICIELAYINAEHPDFMGSSGAFEEMVREKAEETRAEQGTAQATPRRTAPASAPRSTTGIGGVGGKREREADPFGTEVTDSVPSKLLADGPLTDHEKLNTRLLERLLVSYFDIISTKVLDTTPKVIMHFLVNRSSEELRNALVAACYKEDQFDELLAEDPQVAQRRKVLQDRISTLQKTQDVLNEVREYSIS